MKTPGFIILIFSLIMSGSQIYGQINLNKIAKSKINNRAQHRTGQAVDKGLNEIEGVFKNKNPDQSNPKEIREEKTSNEGNPTPAITKKNSPTLESYSKFDFVSGEKIIFYEDFNNVEIGDFPPLWNTNGSAEVVTTNLYPGKWMKFIGRKSIWSDDLLQLPENYTIEFDIIPIKGEDKAMVGYDFHLIQSINAKAFDHGSVPGKAGFSFGVEYFGRPRL